MGFLDKAKQAAEQAATKAKEGVEDAQTKRELSQAYNELGKTTFELIEHGDIANPRLDGSAAKIRSLTAKLETEGADSQTGAADADVYDSSQPPAMPT
jgi:Mrp family chromosome partitioning ATPase